MLILPHIKYTKVEFYEYESTVKISNSSKLYPLECLNLNHWMFCKDKKNLYLEAREASYLGVCSLF